MIDYRGQGKTGMDNNTTRTTAKLLEELATLRQRVAELEAAQAIRAIAEAGEERLRQVIQSMPVMMLAFNESRNRIIVWNHECERVTGFSAEEIVDKPGAFRLIYPDPDYRHYLMQEWRRRGDNYRDFEWEITCKDGTIRIVAWSNISDQFPIPGWGTWAIGVDVTARRKAEAALQAAHDQLEQRVEERTAELAEANARLLAEILERKQAEEALRQSEERLRQVLENMPVMMIAYDEHADTIRVWNRECERVTGYSAAEIVGRSAREINRLLYPDSRYLKRLWKEMIARGDDYRGWEWEWVCKDGSRKTIAWSNISRRFPIPGWATWAIGVDVTERQKAEERAIALGIEQARREMLERFISDASHDLKTPLTTMRLSLGVMRKTLDEDIRARHLAILTAQVNHLEQTVEDLLNIVRLDRASEIVHSPVDLGVLTQGVIAEQTPLIDLKAHRVVFRTEGDSLTIFGDKIELHRAITNLLTNACNYTPAGGTILIRVVRRVDSVALEVQDNGIGISQEELPHIFKRFYRADRARSTNTGGMGLGLPIVLKIVEAHNGKIEVDSTPGQGSTFRLIFPVDAGDSDPAPDEPSSSNGTDR